MIEFVLQDPFVPEGVTLSVSISVYEASWTVPQIERVAKLLFAAQRNIDNAEYLAEKERDNEHPLGTNSDDNNR